jgi:adenosylcobinamide-GDP ribazoletransferase
LDLLLHWGYPLFTEEYRHFPPLLYASIVVVTLIVLTRALHLDGFMDCCDALLGGFNRERRLEILRDSHVGAFAVVGVVSLLLIKVAAIMALPPEGRFWMLLLFPCLSRWAMLIALEFFPYARSQGIGVPFQPKGGRWQLLAGFALAVIAVVAFTGLAGLALLVLASAVAWSLSAWASKLLGGVTGDVYGPSTRWQRRRSWCSPQSWPTEFPTRSLSQSIAWLGENGNGSKWSGVYFPESGILTRERWCWRWRWIWPFESCPVPFTP